MLQAGDMTPACSNVGALYHKLQTQSSAPEDGRNYRPKHVELIEIINKSLMLNLVDCLQYCINDARSHKYKKYSKCSVCVVIQNKALSTVCHRMTDNSSEHNRIHVDNMYV